MSYIWPGMTMGNELDAAKVSHDPKVVRAYETDPLVHDRVSTRFFTEFLAAMETVHAQASRVKNLATGGWRRSSGGFPLGNTIFEKLDLEDKTLHVYDGRYHEIYNEAEDLRRQVLEDLEDWLEKQLFQNVKLNRFP